VAIVETLKEIFMKKSISILIIEDDKNLSNFIELDEFKYYFAKGADEGLRLAKEKNPNLILLDWNASTGNEGKILKLLCKLKSDEKIKHIPIHVMISWVHFDTIGRAIIKASDGFIPKPHKGPFKLGKWTNKEYLSCNQKKLSSVFPAKNTTLECFLNPKGIVNESRKLKNI
jgi:DNA-binding NtrC family response regulator